MLFCLYIYPSTMSPTSFNTCADDSIIKWKESNPAGIQIIRRKYMNILLHTYDVCIDGQHRNCKAKTNLFFKLHSTKYVRKYHIIKQRLWDSVCKYPVRIRKPNSIGSAVFRLFRKLYNFNGKNDICFKLNSMCNSQQNNQKCSHRYKIKFYKGWLPLYCLTTTNSGS